MARSNAKTTNCFSAAMGMKASDVTRLDKLAEGYGTGDITGDYVSAVQDAIAEDTRLLQAIKDAMESGIHKADANNPDNDIGTPLTKRDFANGKDAADWLLANDSRGYMQAVLSKIAPFLSGVQVYVVDPKGALPRGVFEPDAETRVMNRLNYDAKGITHYDEATGNIVVVLRGDIGADHETLAHELVHAATLAAIYKGDKTFDAIAKQVRYALSSSPEKGRTISAAEQEAHNFFSEQFRKPSEFVAYAFTSPTFQNIMKRMAADGRWFTDYRSQANEAKVVAPTPAKMAVPAAPQYSMWQKLVDAVRGLFNLPTKYKADYDRILAARTAAIENNKAAAKVGYVPLQTEISRLLDELLANQPNAVPAANTSSVTRGEPSGSGLISPAVSSSKAAKDQTSATLRAAQPAPSTAVPNAMMAPNIVAREKIMGKLPPGMRPMARAIYTALGRAGETTLNTINFTEDLLARANDAGIKSAETFKSLYTKRANFVGQHERGVQAVADMYAALPDRLKGRGEGTANDFLKQSTMTRKWGYQPDFIKEPVQIDPDMAAAHKALGAEGQKFVEAVFKHGAETLQLKKDTLLANTSSTYDVLIAAANKEGKTDEAASLEADKAKSLKQFGSLMSLQSTDPYAPIKRFGNQVVIAVSDKYKAALAESERTGSMKELRAMQSSEDDYYVDFVDNDREGDALIEKLRGTGLYSTAEDGIIQRQKDETRDQLFGGSGTVSALNKLRAQIDAEYSSGKDNGELRGAARKLNEMVNELYLSALAESSARKSEMRRKGVAGDIDMIRAFETQGKADANFLGAIKFNEETMQAVNDMRREVKSGASEAQNSKSKMFNEIMKRHLQSMEYRPSPLSSKLVNLTSKWFLATNPSYYLQNATQPWMMSLPVMAGRHEFAAAGKALAKAYEDIYTDFKDAKVFAHMDFDKMLDPANKKLSDAEKAMLTDLLERGRIDIGMATELGQFRIEGDGKASDAWNKVDTGIRGLQTKMEALNRVTTALAAYRLELAKSNGDTEAAAAYADRLVSDTHGDYSSWNAPRMFNNDFGKIALQFKKYQLIQLSLMAKMIKQAFGSAPAPEKAMAKKALMFMFGQAAIVGGARAMPFGAIAYMMAAALGDDKEPPEYLFRKWVDNKPIADLLVGGVPALFGVDAQKFGGMGQMLSILPFTDVDLTSRKGVETAGYALLTGPLGGLTLKAADSAGYMANGDYYRGLEGLLPTGFANVMKAGRKATTGEHQKDGDVTMSPEEVTYFQTALTAVGVTPEAQTQKMFRQNTAYDMANAIQQRGTEIKSSYANAVRSGESTSEAMAKWNKYQADRVAAGFKRQPNDQLTSSTKAKGKRETNTVGNVQYQKDNEAYVKRLATL